MIAARCLSVWQPWAWAIVSGWKPVENRTWGTSYRGRLLIHAGKFEDVESIDWVLQQVSNIVNVPKHLVMEQYLKRRHRGAIVGEVDLVDVVKHHPSRWFFGPNGLVLANAKRYKPVKCRGFQTLFVPPDSLLDRDLELDP